MAIGSIEQPIESLLVAVIMQGLTKKVSILYLTLIAPAFCRYNINNLSTIASITEIMVEWSIANKVIIYYMRSCNIKQALMIMISTIKYRLNSITV